MKAYFDLCLYPSIEYSPYTAIGIVYERVHMALVESKDSQIGVSFPKFQIAEGRLPGTLGSVLRMHAQVSSLEGLRKSRWLGPISDLAHVGEIQPTPESIRHRIVRRIQPITNVERLRRRYIKRHRVSEVEAASKIPKSIEERVPLPFVRFRSRSTGQIILLFVHHGEMMDFPTSGAFSSYGLSSEASIPWF